MTATARNSTSIQTVVLLVDGPITTRTWMLDTTLYPSSLLSKPSLWCLLFVLIRQGLRRGSGPQRLTRALGVETGVQKNLHETGSRRFFPTLFGHIFSPVQFVCHGGARKWRRRRLIPLQYVIPGVRRPHFTASILPPSNNAGAQKKGHDAPSKQSAGIQNRWC